MYKEVKHGFWLSCRYRHSEVQTLQLLEALDSQPQGLEDYKTLILEAAEKNQEQKDSVLRLIDDFKTQKQARQILACDSQAWTQHICRELSPADLVDTEETVKEFERLIQREIPAGLQRNAVPVSIPSLDLFAMVARGQWTPEDLSKIGFKLKPNHHIQVMLQFADPATHSTGHYSFEL